MRQQLGKCHHAWADPKFRRNYWCDDIAYNLKLSETVVTEGRVGCQAVIHYCFP